MKNIIIIGGVSCDPDDNEHDANPYNFINPGVKLAKSLGNALVLFHAKSYEIRAKNYPAEKEHSWVAKTAEERKKLPSDHFLKTVKKNFNDVKTITTAGDLTAELGKEQVLTITYFGHSNKSHMFLEYNTDRKGKGIVLWGIEEARKVHSSIFNTASVQLRTPLFASFGCFQAEPGGLCAALQTEWLVKTFGAHGKTNYKPIGQAERYPSGKYFVYPLPVSSGSDMDYGRSTPSSPTSLY
jgi:hypothetical protein